jgi:hypothetical protein
VHPGLHRVARLRVVPAQSGGIRGDGELVLTFWSARCGKPAAANDTATKTTFL